MLLVVQAVSLSVSAGYYNQGAGKDPGHDLGFYSQLRLEYQLSHDAKAGLGFGHISNAAIGGKNPATETACLSYSIAF